MKRYSKWLEPKNWVNSYQVNPNPWKRGKKEGPKQKNRHNDKEIQIKSAVQENVVQNEKNLERSVHPSENSITKKIQD